MSKKVSIIIPIRNEENYIKQCIESVLEQDYPKKDMEILLVDGMSTDKTREILKYYITQYDFIQLIDNVNITTPFAMNIGIENSTGEYIIRLDAHSVFPPNYVRKCVETLDTIDADVVGGLAITKGRNKFGKVVAKLLSSPFGVGNSKFRTYGKSGYVDTVPFGAFRREVFKKYGKYDTRLTRTQDYEFNQRIRKNGGKIYLSNEIMFTYYCRESLSSLIKSGVRRGRWIMTSTKYNPGVLALRHYIPFLFVLSLIAGIFILITPFKILKILFLFELASYGILDIFYSFKQSKFNLIQFVLLLILFPLFHISCGIGSFIGIIKPAKS